MARLPLNESPALLMFSAHFQCLLQFAAFNTNVIHQTWGYGSFHGETVLEVSQNSPTFPHLESLSLLFAWIYLHIESWSLLWFPGAATLQAFKLHYLLNFHKTVLDQAKGSIWTLNIPHNGHSNLFMADFLHFSSLPLSTPMFTILEHLVVFLHVWQKCNKMYSRSRANE